MAAILNSSNSLKKTRAHHVPAHLQKNLSWPLAAISNFGNIFKKSLAHPHVAQNVMLKFEKKMTKLIFWVFAPTNKFKLIRGGHFEFQ